MPAVTVPDITVLPRVAEPDPATTTTRPVLASRPSPTGHEGEGFPVRRSFAGINQAYLDPFIHMDQMGEIEYAPGEPRALPGTRTAASRPSPTCSTGRCSTRTPRAAAA